VDDRFLFPASGIQPAGYFFLTPCCARQFSRDFFGAPIIGQSFCM
jgi:hypothetical protein